MERTGMDTFTILGRARLEALEDLVEEAKEAALVEIYEDDGEKLEEQYARTVRALLEARALADSLLYAATDNFRVRL